MSDDWVKELNPGDEVGVANNRRTAVRFAKVDKVTPSGQVVVGRQRFRIKWGRAQEIGEHLYPEELLPKEVAIVLQESIQKDKERHQLVKSFGSEDWNQFSNEQLNQIKALMDSFRGGDRQ